MSTAVLGHDLPDTIAAAQAALRARSLTSERLTQELLSRAAQAGDNAFISLDADGALVAARSADATRDADGAGADRPLSGIPLVVKDNVHVAGLPNTAGTPAFATYVPAQHATAVSRLIEAGAIIVGKTNMHELALGATSANTAYGTVRNPWDSERVAGGSSGGTAAAIAAGSAVAGLGTDTGGSVRIPSSLCGICGFRPTVGRYPGDGLTPLSWTRDTVGPMARTVEDLIVLDEVLGGDATPAVSPDPATLRIGIPMDAFTVDLGQGVEVRWLAALDRLRAHGIALIDVSMREVAELNAKVGPPVILHETPRALRRYLSEYEVGVTFDQLVRRIASPDVAALFADAIVDGAPSAVSESAYRVALHDARPRLQERYRSLFGDHALDAIAVPTTPIPAIPVEQVHVRVALGGSLRTPLAAYIRNSEPCSNAGTPSVSIRLDGRVDAPPLGLQLDGPENSDRRLLAIARAVERILTPDA